MQKQAQPLKTKKIIMKNGVYGNSSETPRDVYITLPREPWLTEEDHNGTPSHAYTRSC